MTDKLYSRDNGPCIHGHFKAHQHGNPVTGWNIRCEGGRYKEIVLDHEAAETAVMEIFEMNVLTGVGFSESDIVNMVLKALCGVDGKPKEDDNE